MGFGVLQVSEVGNMREAWADTCSYGEKCITMKNMVLFPCTTCTCPVHPGQAHYRRTTVCPQRLSRCIPPLPELRNKSFHGLTPNTTININVNTATTNLKPRS